MTANHVEKMLLLSLSELEETQDQKSLAHISISKVFISDISGDGVCEECIQYNIATGE